jgi:hypothetical protein
VPDGGGGFRKRSELARFAFNHHASLKKSKCDRASLEGLVGEVCFVGVPSAIANAVYQATGPRIRSLRITIDQLL